MKQPTVQYWTWPRALPQIAIVALLVIFLSAVFPPERQSLALVVAPGIFLAYSFISRLALATDHRKGLLALSQKEYDSAVVHFEDSFSFFSRYAWLDKYRAVTMMTPSVWTFREMALMNIAAVYSERGDVESAMSTYNRVLEEYPKNIRASKALAFIESVKATNGDQ